MPVKNVFRCIIKHIRSINDSRITSEIPRVKALIKRPSISPARHRRQIADLYLLEESLRSVRLGRSTIARVQSIFGANRSKASRSQELNQSGSLDLYMQHKMRRFDKYNRPPSPDSELAAEVHRRAAFANQFWNFARQYNHCEGVHPDASEVSDLGKRRWSVLMGTILAPYEAQRTQKQRKNRYYTPSKAVRVKIVERNSLSLPVLHIGGSVMRNRGFKRHIAAVSQEILPRCRLIDEKIWLASQYSQDPLDGEDMTEYIGQLKAEKSRLKSKFGQLEQQLEVQRRILMQRKTQLEQKLAWQNRRRAQNNERRAKLHPPQLLTLADL